MTATRKQSCIGCIALVILPTGLILYLLFTHIWIHDWHLWRFSRSFARITHPPTTRHLKSYQELGLLIGNGNHIELFAGELRSYIGTRQDIVNWYASQHVPAQLAPGMPEAHLPVEVVFLDQEQFTGDNMDFEPPYPLSDILRDSQRPAPSSPTLYIVFALGNTAFDTGLDIRGW